MAHDRRTFLRSIGAGSIGALGVSALGGTATAATVITMEGGGADIWSTEDAFHYYYGRADGDFDVVVRNTGVEDTDSWAKAGLMVRESTAADSRNVMLRRRPNGEASLQWRLEDGADSDSGDVAVEGGWLRLTRTGTTVEGFAAADEPDGEDDWTALGRVDIDLADDALLGLAVTSHNEGTLCTAGFQNLSGVSPATNEDVGDVEVGGSVDVEEGVPFASTGEVTDVTAASATLNGELADLGGADAAEAYFEYREVPTESWIATESETLTEPGSYSVDVDGLTSRRYYEVRAVVDTDDGDSARGSTVQFGTAGRSSGRSDADAGPESRSHFEPGDGFAESAPWLDDETPIVKITEPTREQLDRAAKVNGPRLVVFETSGTVDLGARNLEIPYDECYIAGQTAPSPGITLVRGGLYVEADDCVVQHVRARPGDADQEQGSGWEPDAIHTGDDTENNVVDHCSASWAVDECLSVGYRSEDSTVSNCLVGPALHEATHTKGNHGYGSLIGDDAENVALLGNVWAHNRARNPRLKTGTRSVVVNNVMYSFDEAATLDGDTYASIVGNGFLRVDEGDANVEGGNAYLEDNYSEPETPMADVDRVLDEPPLWPDGLEAMSSTEVLEHALRNVGARPADRTAYDEEIVRQIAERDGEWIDSQAEVGGYPDLPENTHDLDVPESGTRAWLRSWARRVETAE